MARIAEITVTPQAADYARRINEVGQLRRLARKVNVVEASIARDLDRRRDLGQSPTPLPRAIVIATVRL